MDRQNTYPELIKSKAAELGFDDCGIAACRPMKERKNVLERWIGAGYGGGLGYMERNIEKRLDPSLLLEGARSVIICAASYKRPPAITGSVASRIASYALTRDYHLTIREKLGELLEYLGELYSGTSGKVFVDTAPLLEKAWATEAGLGWQGRNSLLIHPRLGSFILLGGIITDAEITPDKPYLADGCKGCRKCEDSCPAGAINGDRTIDASKCISRFTIEKAEKIPSGEQNLHGWVFGCDVCQQVCPRNSRVPVVGHDYFEPVQGITEMTASDWLSISQTQFDEKFSQTPLARCPLDELKKRIASPPVINKE